MQVDKKIHRNKKFTYINWKNDYKRFKQYSRSKSNCIHDIKDFEKNLDQNLLSRYESKLQKESAKTLHGLSWAGLVLLY